ncbi:MAG: carbonate dehydratase [Kiritimatiellia bacterium]|jgi:carbonic anhydrase|nr:carbonate dehydratase [Kiritimatiellia bacterium]
MKTLSHLFEQNRNWADGRRQADATFFKKLTRQQAPEYLWIGCSDSRVPANEIVGLPPGELFVHRNVANLVIQSDINCLSTIQYAVEALKVTHIIVFGHYDCGGIQAAMETCSHGLVDNWLGHVRDIARRRRTELDSIPDEPRRLERLCEMNIEEQVLNVGRTTPVQAAWARGQPLMVHGWVYHLTNGLLMDLSMSIASDEELRALEDG